MNKMIFGDIVNDRVIDMFLFKEAKARVRVKLCKIVENFLMEEVVKNFLNVY